MSDGTLFFLIFSVLMMLSMFFLPSVGDGRVAPPPPRKGAIVDRFGLPMVSSGAKMPPVKPIMVDPTMQSRPFADAVMPDEPWPRGSTKPVGPANQKFKSSVGW